MRPPRTVLPRPTDRLLIGGLPVSPIALGLTNDPRTVPAAFDAGINFFFLTADMHWPHYEATRAGLIDLAARGRSVRDQMVLAVASYVTQPEFCRLPFSEVLDVAPSLERIDLAVIGGAYRTDFWARLPIYQRQRDERWCGSSRIGASFHERTLAREVIAQGLLDVGFVRYNARHLGALDNLFPFVPDSPHMPLYNFSSTRGWVPPVRFAELALDEDHWQPRVPDHYRFALSRPEVDGLLVTVRTPRELDELVSALSEGPLSSDEAEHLVALAELADAP